MSGMFCGMCGNYDGQPNNDMRLGANNNATDYCPELQYDSSLYGHLVSLEALEMTTNKNLQYMGYTCPKGVSDIFKCHGVQYLNFDVFNFLVFSLNKHNIIIVKIPTCCKILAIFPFSNCNRLLMHKNLRIPGLWKVSTMMRSIAKKNVWAIWVISECNSSV